MANLVLRLRGSAAAIAFPISRLVRIDSRAVRGIAREQADFGSDPE